MPLFSHLMMIWRLSMTASNRAFLEAGDTTSLVRKYEHPSGISVEFLDYMGDDLAIVNAARVSYAMESWWEEAEKLILNGKDAGLINYLMRERHGTPFEMVQMKFRVIVPIGVAREWMRHRIGSFNEVSTRYVEMKPEFYIPTLELLRVQVGKPGHYIMEPMPEEMILPGLKIYRRSVLRSYREYERLLETGWPLELARNVLPLALFTSFIWSVNLRSCFNFMNLRTAPNALREIQIPAGMVEDMCYIQTPNAMKAWNKHDRRAP
jgi:thymidylate synthase (FAD)